LTIFNATITTVVKGNRDAPLRTQGNKLLMEIELIFEKEDYKLISISAIKPKDGKSIKDFKIQVKTGRDVQIMDFISMFNQFFDFNEVSAK